MISYIYVKFVTDFSVFMICYPYRTFSALIAALSFMMYNSFQQISLRSTYLLQMLFSLLSREGIPW